MNKKGISMLVVVAIVVIIVVVAGIAVYVLYSGGTGEPEPTPSPSPTGIEGATSLQFTVEITGGESEGTYNYYAKNIGTDDLMVRVEIPDYDFAYIVNGAEQKAWANDGAGWVDLSSTFQDQWGVWEPTYQAYAGQLASWASGDWTYTDGDSTVTITDIIVNPSLEDSLFQAPS